MTEELPWDFGQMLTSAIEHSRFKSRRQIAALAGLTAPTITNLETGTKPIGGGLRAPNRNPDLDTVVRIARVLEMPLRKSLELAGLGDKIPEGMTDDELMDHFTDEVATLLDGFPAEALAAALLRKAAKADQD
jgi:transcriptional regulator with XRE-family HTH domain